MRNFVCEPLTKDQVKELCSVIHNAETEAERNEAKHYLAYSFEEELYYIARKELKDIRGKKYFDAEELDRVVERYLNVLYDYAEKYDPDHSSGATLLTYAWNELKRVFLLETNKGMTETEIRNYNRIYTAQKHYELVHHIKWQETENSLTELSDICGLSEKVIKKTLAVKKELNKKTVSYDAANKDGESTFAETLPDTTYTLERQWEVQNYRNILNSFSEEENAIFYTWVDTDSYKLLSEREGIRRLSEMGYSIGRGTLNSRREALKAKIWSAMYDTDYRSAA